MLAFEEYLRSLLERAGREAQDEGSTTIEAHHLLLAMAAGTDTETSRFLQSIGLDHGALRTAFTREFEDALGAAGVSLTSTQLPRPKSSTHPIGHLGTSVQHALERGLGGLREAPRPGHVLLGVLQATVGVVPRALAIAGLDRDAIIERVRETLGGSRTAASG